MRCPTSLNIWKHSELTVIEALIQMVPHCILFGSRLCRFNLIDISAVTKAMAKSPLLHPILNLDLRHFYSYLNQL